MNFENYLKSESAKIDAALKKVLFQWEKEMKNTSKKLIFLAKSFSKANFGGKKIRGALILLGYEIAKGNSEKEVLNVSAAYEIFHTSILAHDDVIDKSIQRRGQPSLYTALGQGHYGISQAICLGDIGFFLAVKIISESNFPQKEKNQAIQFFSKTMLDTAVGEMLDVELPYTQKKGSQKDINTIMKLKTGKYTISAPLQLGAILAGADESFIKLLGEFGGNLGIAFQIQDDILGVFGNEQETGKSASSDVEEGKNTLLYAYALDKANSHQLSVINRYYGKGKVGNDGLKQLRNVFQEVQAVEYARKKASEYVSSASKIIPKISDSIKIKEVLAQMTEYLIKRRK